jgi:hypothetical protein
LQSFHIFLFYIFCSVKRVANIKLIFAAAALLLTQNASAAVNPHSVTDIFKEISAHLKSGDAGRLTAHFAATVELRILSAGKTHPAKQAAAAVEAFFAQHKPVNFAMLHIGSKASKHYGIGLLTTGNGRFRVTVFLSTGDRDAYTIQQLCIDHED